MNPNQPIQSGVSRRIGIATALQIMNKTEVLKRIRDTGLIPVVRAESADHAVRAVEALKAGGLDVLEVTMTVPGAIEVIRSISSRVRGGHIDWRRHSSRSGNDASLYRGGGEVYCESVAQRRNHRLLR